MCVQIFAFVGLLVILFITYLLGQVSVQCPTMSAESNPNNSINAIERSASKFVVNSIEFQLSLADSLMKQLNKPICVYDAVGKFNDAKLAKCTDPNGRVINYKITAFGEIGCLSVSAQLSFDNKTNTFKQFLVRTPFYALDPSRFTINQTSVILHKTTL